MSYLIYAMFGICGFFAGIMVRLIRTNRDPLPIVKINTDSTAIATDQSVGAKLQIDFLMASLFDLTSHVGDQVGQHSLRMDEITKSLNSSSSTGSDLILTAGKLLVTANHELQSELSDAKAEIEKQRDELSRSVIESRTDALTGLQNRRAFDQELVRTLAIYRRKSTPFTLLMLDIDHFKRLNDQHGHMVGDQVLKAFARCLTGVFRETDFIGRFGGEEFAAILPQTLLHEGLIAAERTRKAIADCRYAAGEDELQVTASIGVKEISGGESDSELIQKTDEALYAAKRGGRNCCWFHDGITVQQHNPDSPQPTFEQPTNLIGVSDDEFADRIDDSVQRAPSPIDVRKMKAHPIRNRETKMQIADAH